MLLRLGRASLPAILVIASAGTMSACVSAPQATLQSAVEETEPALPDDPPLLTVALDPASGETAAVVPDPVARAEAIEKGEVEAAMIVPQSAPRDIAAPQSAESIALAFAADGSGQQASAAALNEQASTQTDATQSVVSTHLPEEGSSDGPLEATTDPTQVAAITPPPGQRRSAAADDDERPNSLFEWLYAKRQQELAASQTATRNSPQQTQKTARTLSADAALLPGVKSGDELFDLQGDEDIDSHGEPFELASATGMARISPNGIATQTDKVEVACFRPQLVAILKHIERRYNRPAIVTSGYRSPKDNRRAGGARRSMHMDCAAADIQVEGISKWSLAKYLRTVSGRGGVGTYCRTESVHIDIGKEREWHHPCRRKKASRKS